MLVPGIAGDPHEMLRLVPYLGGRDARVVRLPEVEVDSLAEIGRLVDVPRDALVVAASFGALVARTWPNRLVTIGALPAYAPVARRAGWMGRLVARMPERMYREWYGRRSRAAWREDDADDELIESIRLPNREVLAARLRAIGRWGLPPLPPGTPCLWGATDRFARWTHGEVVAAGGVPVVVPGGHRPHVSHPAEVAGWVR